MRLFMAGLFLICMSAVIMHAGSIKPQDILKAVMDITPVQNFEDVADDMSTAIDRMFR